MATYKMLIDSGKCVNCKACIVACQQRNNVPYGVSRNWIRQTPHSESPTGEHYQPGACMHCDPAPCVYICPTQATWRNEAGVVVIDQERCVGCGACVDVCPYGARFRHPEKKVADKCDYCQASGLPPACVSVCPTRSRIFGDVDDPESEVAIALKTRKAQYLQVDNASVAPTLAYLDATIPASIPGKDTSGHKFKAIGAIGTGLTWVSGLVLAAVGGVFIRNLLRPAHPADSGSSDHNTKSDG